VSAKVYQKLSRVPNSGIAMIGFPKWCETNEIDVVDRESLQIGSSKSSNDTADRPVSRRTMRATAVGGALTRPSSRRRCSPY